MRKKPLENCLGNKDHFFEFMHRHLSPPTQLRHRYIFTHSSAPFFTPFFTATTDAAPAAWQICIFKINRLFRLDRARYNNKFNCRPCLKKPDQDQGPNFTIPLTFSQ